MTGEYTRNDGHGTAPLDCGSSPQRACATVVSSRYSAWRVPATLWILPCINMDGASTLWIDESLMNLYEILGFQPEGVATL